MGLDAQPVRARSSWWRFAREAVVGTQQDFTVAPIGRSVALLAIPMVLEMSMESTFGLVDAFFVARLGKAAAATVGLTESLLILIFGVALGLSFSTTAMVARRIGEKDEEGAAVAASQAILLGIVFAGITGVLGVIFAPELLELLGAEAAIVREGANYTRVILGASVVIFLLFLNNAIFRGAGDAAIALRTLMLSNAINLVLAPALIFGIGPFPKLGLLGAAIGTTIGRGTGVAFQLWTLFTSGRRLQLARRHLRLDVPVMWRLLRVSLTGIFQIEVATASWTVLIRIMAGFGSAALAGNTFALRILQVAQLPAWGMSNAAATLVGQNLGAKKPERAERAVWITGLYNLGYLCLVGFLLMISAEKVLHVFSNDPEVVRNGAACFVYICAGWPFWAWAIVFLQAFNGAGDTVTPSYINFFCYWIWQIPAAWVLAVHFQMGPRGVYAAILGTAVLMGVIYLILFRRGRWKHQRV